MRAHRPLKDDFHRLATLVDSFPKTIIHRDYQSQILWSQRGKCQELLDFQGARIGPPGYDIASILWDPYARIDDAQRERILEYYLSAAMPLNQSFKVDEFLKTLGPLPPSAPHASAPAPMVFSQPLKGKHIS